MGWSDVQGSRRPRGALGCSTPRAQGWRDPGLTAYNGIFSFQDCVQFSVECKDICPMNEN